MLVRFSEMSVMEEWCGDDCFRKRCPTCGGRQLVARPQPASGLPTAPTYACVECRRLLRFYFLFSVSAEQRRFPRRRLPSFFLVRMADTAHQYARIKNISEGGLCFDQHYHAAPLATRRFTVDLFNCNDGSSLEQLPAEIVATCEQLFDVNGVKTTVVNHRVRFVRLNRAQRKVLHLCLAQYGI